MAEQDAAEAAAAPPAEPGDIERFLLIIGAMKSGTTTLFEYLSQHPQIARSRGKEPNAFGKPLPRAAFRARCRRLWRGFDPARHRYAMEASTNYTKAPRYRASAERIAEYGARTALIYIVRDPVDRIESHIAHNIAEGRVGPDIAWDHPMLRQAIDVSRYARQLARYARVLPDREILVLDFEELKRDPLAVTRRCVDFLGIDAGFAFTPIPPANTRKTSGEGEPFRLSDALRARLAAELAPDARRFAADHGFDIAAWDLEGAAPETTPVPERPAAPATAAPRAPAARSKPIETPLIFHIGMAKTGSSAIQRALYGSEAYLAGKGVLYPHNRARPELHNHKLLAARIAPFEKLPRHMARLGAPERVLEDADAFLRELKAELAARRPDLLLLSSETMFMRIGAGYGRQLRASFADLGVRDPAFVAYLRRPSERYASGLQQVLRSLDKLVQPRPPRYRKTIEGYADLFGAGALRLAVFHRPLLKDGDVVADFVARHLAAYGVAFADLAPVGDRNVSMSAEVMSILQEFRQTGPGDQEAGGLRTALREAEEALGAARLRLRPGIAEMVDHANDEPLWLRDVHGIVFPDFDYRPLEEGRLTAPLERPLTLDEIVVIDPDRRRALLERLARAAWAKPAPRRDWLRGALREAAIR